MKAIHKLVVKSHHLGRITQITIQTQPKIKLKAKANVNGRYGSLEFYIKKPIKVAATRWLGDISSIKQWLYDMNREEDIEKFKFTMGNAGYMEPRTGHFQRNL